MAEPGCQGCRVLGQRVAELEAQVRELLARLGQHAGNSSVPPSANPPAAPKPVVKQATGRKPGGQPGHEPHARLRLGAERVDEFIHHLPSTCKHCAQPLPAAAGPDDPPPTWHQVAELPPLVARISEHQGHARTCPQCGTVTRASIPADVRAHVFGPRLTAAVAYLSGAQHASKRGVEEAVETLFHVPLALGTVAAAEQEVSAALADAHAEAAQAARQAAVKHVDETSWKRAGKLCWLWTAVTAQVAYFAIHAQRGRIAFQSLLGEVVQGIVNSDRWGAYNRLDVQGRQLCWAHLQRDFQALVDRGGAAAALGEELLCYAQDVFTWWYRVRDGTLSRASFQTYIGALRPRLRAELQAGQACGCAKAAALCGNLLAWEPALWTFVRVEGVEPTNNTAERALRPAVLWRRRSFGCHSEAGCRYVERMLTVVQTLRLHKRCVLDYLVDAVTAHRQCLTTPKLLPER